MMNWLREWDTDTTGDGWSNSSSRESRRLTHGKCLPSTETTGIPKMRMRKKWGKSWQKLSWHPKKVSLHSSLDLSSFLLVKSVSYYHFRLLTHRKSVWSSQSRADMSHVSSFPRIYSRQNRRPDRNADCSRGGERECRQTSFSYF